HGDVVKRKMESKTLEVAGDGDRTLVTFLWPADVKGTKMLTWTHKAKEDDQWLYLPALKRVKRINSRSKTGSFMGSEFSYEDIGGQEAEKFDYKFIKDDALEKRKVWVLERVAKDKKSGYSKQVVWMDQEYNSPLKIEYYDRKSELLKVSILSGHTKINKWWRAGQIAMENVQTKKKSIISWTGRKLGKSLSKSIFNKSRLK
ncbi:outer membrane lipoprotein-sorting protein, partial [bacterium]|nr:outer membrane lipoprotein-sorting protein [bacterium]